MMSQRVKSFKGMHCYIGVEFLATVDDATINSNAVLDSLTRLNLPYQEKSWGEGWAPAGEFVEFTCL